MNLHPNVKRAIAEQHPEVLGKPEKRHSGPRPLRDRFSKAELRWMADWGRHYTAEGAVAIHPQVTLRFTDGTSYTVDFLVIWPDRAPTCVEVKAGYRGPGWEQGYERYRRAKQAWSWFAWELHEWQKGEWRVTE